MKRRNHFFITFSLALWLYYFILKFNLSQTFLLSFFTAYLSWLPDIDLKIIKKLEKFEKKKTLSAFLFKPFLFLLKKFLKHRGITHSIWPILLLIFLDLEVNDYLISIFLKIIYFALIFHVIEDSFTVSGVNFFYPLNFRLKLAKFKSNSKTHIIFFDLLSFFLVVFFFYVIKEQL